MQKNVHKVERVIRVVVGAGLVSLAFVGPASPWFFIGLVPIATGLLGWCPPYAIFGINTCKLGKSS